MSETQWSEFKQWLQKTHVADNATGLLRYAKKYSYILQQPNRAFELQILNKDTKRGVMASLSNLSKYLGVYEQWKQTIKNHGLKWENTSSFETFISILNSNIHETKSWLLQTVRALPKDYATVLVFDALSGLRPSEACQSCKLLSELSEQKTLKQYLDKDLMMLQHFRFPKMFLRRSKNAYISFITPELLTAVQINKPKIHYDALDTKIGRLGLKVQTKQLRKLHGITLRNLGMPQEIVDLLQGRISQNVFTRFYYKPFLEDIRSKTLQGIEPLQKELLEIIS